MIRVPFVDLYQQHQEVEAELVEVFQRVLRKSSFILGPEVQTFERSFASYVGSAECIAVNSGTAALQLVLLGLDMGRGRRSLRFQTLSSLRQRRSAQWVPVLYL